MIQTFGFLVAFAVSAAAGCAAAAVFLAGWQLKPQHLSPEGELTTYG
jgi:hypothetical protein